MKQMFSSINNGASRSSKSFLTSRGKVMVIRSKKIMNHLAVLSFLLLAIVAVFKAENLDDLLKIMDLSQCKYQIETVGCFKDDPHDRLFDTELINGRDDTNPVYTLPSVQWRNYNHWLANFICECATRLMEQKNVESDYIGLQYYAECWTNFKQEITEREESEGSSHARHGKLTSCVDGDFNKYSTNHKKCQVYMGQTSSNFVYKVSKRPNEENNCSYFTKRGCFKDTTPRLDFENKPLPFYAMNERDPTAPNWNGHSINWKKWGNGYLNGLLCRCAQKAKEMNKRFFGIQYYGECWVGDDESKISKDGQAETCLDKKFKPTCSEDSSDQCQPKLCVGEGKTNMVYELHQGPLGCLKNPCGNGERCIPNGANNHSCESDAQP